MSSSGLMSLAIVAMTSAFGLPRLDTVAPAWRLKLTMSKTSKSAI